MSKKISELSDASALDGSELFECVQSGDNKKTTISTIYTVDGSLGGNRVVDLNGNILEFSSTGSGLTLSITPNILIKSSGTNGETLTIEGTETLDNDGGNILLLGGTPSIVTQAGKGGNVTIMGGTGKEQTQFGGQVSITGGTGEADPVNGGGSSGGDVVLSGGNSAVGPDGGSVRITVGEGVSSLGHIEFNAAGSFITYTADTHTFNVGMTITELAGVGTRAIAVDANGKIVLL